MPDTLYPLRFKPLFRQYIWGGRRLASFLNKPIGAGEDFAESWELVDHDEDQSVVVNGELAGVSISKLIEKFGADLLGDSCLNEIGHVDRPPKLKNRFPLLLKFLDANRVLSVQVHPDDRYGKTMPVPDLGKTEAWYVLHAEPNSVIYAGLNPGVTKAQLANAITNGTTESCLNVINPKRGDCIFIPAGTVHAIGAGLVIAEIQQSSDTTFRLFDWNRLDKNGQSRPLHVDQSLEVIDYDRGPVFPQKPKQLFKTEGTECYQLVSCDKFVLNRWTSSEPIEFGGDGRFRIITPIRGVVGVANDPSSQQLRMAETILLPASLKTNVAPIEAKNNDSQYELIEIHLP